MIAKRIAPIVVACIIAVGVSLWFFQELSKLSSALAMMQALLHRSNHELSELKSGMLQFNLSDLPKSSGITQLEIHRSTDVSLIGQSPTTGKNPSSPNENNMNRATGDIHSNMGLRSGMNSFEWKSFVALQLHATSNFSAAMYAR
jgi:hypothetical protein